jgi:hypothetical protein
MPGKIKIIAAAAFFLAAASLFAREITIIVIDIDLDFPLEGATVRSFDGSEFICDEYGKVVINIPGNTQVIIQGFYPGYDVNRIIIPLEGNIFTLTLQLSGIMQGREIVVEAARPVSVESKLGRSVAVGEKEIAQTGEIGIVEDVMNTIKLLPGVNYTTFGAMPSIRGGDPGDLIASLDGYYINNPYFWGGAFSIFDPRMVQNARLSHGVFSSRYGHTISGLLEIGSKKVSSEEIRYDFGVSASAASLYLSFPFSGNGGMVIMGRVTYYDPFIALAKQLSKKIPSIETVNSIEKAPYIRAVTVNGNYRFSNNIELAATGFFGMDGVGLYYLNSSRQDNLDSDSSMKLDFTNYQGFFNTLLTMNPRNDILLKFSAGTGCEDQEIDGIMAYNIHNKEFSQSFADNYSELGSLIKNAYQYHEEGIINQSDFVYNAQGRVDLDWEISRRIILSAGIQEMYNRFSTAGEQTMINDVRFEYLDNASRELIKFLFIPYISGDSQFWNNLRIGVPVSYSPNYLNNLFTTSGYIIGEYFPDNDKLSAELGLRIDHFVLAGDGFTAQSAPALNPRLNVDYNIYKSGGFFQSIDITTGTGLFSSVNSALFSAEEKFMTGVIKPNRSWTSILGLAFEFPQELSFNIEGYYKYVFDRTYIPVGIGLDELNIEPQYDGEGRVWGIDMMLQKSESGFIDGWLVYSYNWAKYRDPAGRFGTMGISGGNKGDDWYFAGYHRFHNLNLILNVKPWVFLNIYFRFGLASGVQLSRRITDAPLSYPVLMYDRDNPVNSYFIEKYYWPSVPDESNRTTPAMPFDIKITYLGKTKKRKANYEIYLAVENILSLLYTSQGNTRFNSYTGQIDTGSNSANYGIPIPIPSFGFKMSY